MNNFFLEHGHVWRALAAHLNLNTLEYPHENRIFENGIDYDCTYRLWCQKKRYYADLLTIFREPFVASMAILCLGQKNRKINTLFKDKKHAEPEPIIGSCCWAITIEQIHVIVIVFVYLE